MSFFLQLKNVLINIGNVFKGVSNLPNYQAYVNHLKLHHPEQTPPTEKEFFEQYLADKYGPSATRC
ncbi:YbdD/YjiX family protein [Fictibacillus iocasae]|uniref:YbdD/YjiX family protein n=1 Tax=Fictibacillus iocasae TaxID=2715437 RepID=A0ABW2NW86_9BACL